MGFWEKIQCKGRCRVANISFGVKGVFQYILTFLEVVCGLWLVIHWILFHGVGLVRHAKVLEVSCGAMQTMKLFYDFCKYLILQRIRWRCKNYRITNDADGDYMIFVNEFWKEFIPTKIICWMTIAKWMTWKSFCWGSLAITFRGNIFASVWRLGPNICWSTIAKVDDLEFFGWGLKWFFQ